MLIKKIIVFIILLNCTDMPLLGMGRFLTDPRLFNKEVTKLTLIKENSDNLQVILNDCLQSSKKNKSNLERPIQDPFTGALECPLTLAIRHYKNISNEIVANLLEAGADPLYDIDGKRMPLDEVRDVKMMQLLLQYNNDENKFDKAFESLLNENHYKVWEKKERVQCLEWLLQQGVNPNVARNYSYNDKPKFFFPLTHLITMKDLQSSEDEIVLLITYGADPEKENDFTKSASERAEEYVLDFWKNLLKKERTNYKNKMECLRLILIGNYRGKKNKAKNPDSLFSRLPPPIIKKIGLYVLGRIE